jgi:hypothetical protein
MPANEIRPSKQARKRGLANAAKARDGWICQCCWRAGDEAHHLEPLCYGGTDELNNLVTLCGECHGAAPDQPSAFLEYQKRGGAFWMLRLPRLRAEHQVRVLRQAMELGKPAPGTEEIEAEFRDLTLDARWTRYGLPASEALLWQGKAGFRRLEQRSRDENSEQLKFDEELARKRLIYFRDLLESIDASCVIAEKLLEIILGLESFIEEVPRLQCVFGRNDKDMEAVVKKQRCLRALGILQKLNGRCAEQGAQEVKQELDALEAWLLRPVGVYEDLQ